MLQVMPSIGRRRDRSCCLGCGVGCAVERLGRTICPIHSPQPGWHRHAPPGLPVPCGLVVGYGLVPPRNCARVVMLSSCEGGAQGTSAGAEVLGPSSLLLARGTASVVAPLTVVGDLECGDFVSDVYDAWVNGDPIATAVRTVRRKWLADDDLSRWAVATSFNCFGSGRSAACSAI
jgi:hypothetical protein